MTCSNCTFWDQSQCKHDAPRLTSKGAAWPVTLATDWCGQWVERPHRISAEHLAAIEKRECAKRDKLLEP